MAKQEPKKPEKKIRSGRVSATIWKNQMERDGAMVDTHSVQIEKSYKDKEDKWQTTNSYNKNDLADLELVTQEARRYLSIKGDKEEE